MIDQTMTMPALKAKAAYVQSELDILYYRGESDNDYYRARERKYWEFRKEIRRRRDAS